MSAQCVLNLPPIKGGVEWGAQASPCHHGRFLWWGYWGHLSWVMKEGGANTKVPCACVGAAGVVARCDSGAHQIRTHPWSCGGRGVVYTRLRCGTPHWVQPGRRAGLAGGHGRPASPLCLVVPWGPGPLIGPGTG